MASTARIPEVPERKVDGFMAKSLVIVESPAKVKTLSKFLGKSYMVKASMGHVRDLPKSRFGIDIENGFAPDYILIRGKGQIISELKEARKKADRVILATDPDREGEAISWHLAQILGIPPEEPCRIEFNEITRQAVGNALKNPRAINTDLVAAQQARRILDRIVGYKLSPFLWKKVKRGLSAGRVQSVAVRLICDREKEIEAFVPEEYWTITAELTPDDESHKFAAELVAKGKQKVTIRSSDEAEGIRRELAGATYVVEDVEKKKRSRHPAPPFTTSTLQQEASRKLGFSARKTMTLAQGLYEGLELGEEGSVALVTYIRTDSTRVAREAQEDARSYIRSAFGDTYLPEAPPHYKARATSQDAHEAIRPTSVFREPAQVKPYLSRDHYRLYELIWRRFVASQMQSASFLHTSVNIRAGEYILRATGQVMEFPGFIAVYVEGAEDSPEGQKPGDVLLPELAPGDNLLLLDLIPLQHFTEPPPRYSEAALVKALEEAGIGRPSTYAPIIDTIQKRGYVYLDNKRFRPTELGFIVTDILREAFPDVVDIGFTAQMEDDLDRIASGEREWVEVVRSFYGPFERSLLNAESRVEKVALPVEETGEKCPNCGRNLVIKEGRFGKFLACPGFPECKFTRKLVPEVGVACPVCGAPIVQRRTQKGRAFYGCSKYPECNFVTWNIPVKRECPKCGAFLVKGRGKSANTLSCVREGCDYTESLDVPPQAGSQGVIDHKSGVGEA